MSLELDNILITGRIFEEYTAFFDLDTESLKAKKVLDCPSGASSFIAQAKEHGIEAQGSDILYQLPLDAIKWQGLKSIEKIYEDTAWMHGFNFEFYGSIEQHRGYRDLLPLIRQVDTKRHR